MATSTPSRIPIADTECERVARWMMDRGYATGHGDTIEDLLGELEWQAMERQHEKGLEVLKRYRKCFFSFLPPGRIAASDAPEAAHGLARASRQPRA
jgi:hypothetical protein